MIIEVNRIEIAPGKIEEAMEWAKDNMVPYFPIGDTKMSEEVAALKKGK